MDADEVLGGRSGDAVAHAVGRRRHGHRRNPVGSWTDRLLRGPGRVLDHPAPLRVLVVVGVLAAAVLGLNVISPPSPSAGDAAPAATPCAPSQDSGTCPSTTTTTPVAPPDHSTTVGGVWADSATVSGSIGAPVGTVTFYVCSPAQLGGAPGCTSALGTQVPSAGGVANPVPLTPGSGSSSTAMSPPVTASQAGTWCFAAYYTPGAQVVGADLQGGQGVPGGAGYGPSSDTSSNECFAVQAATPTPPGPVQDVAPLAPVDPPPPAPENPATPGISSQQSASLNGLGSVAPNFAVADRVTLTGNSVGGPPTGSVSFVVCGPTPSPAPCADGYTVGGSVQLSVTGAETATASSIPFYPSEAGTWCFGASYTPARGARYTATTENQTAPADVNECFVVGAPSFRVLKTNVPGDGEPVTPGSTVPYTIDIQNVGDAAGQATVTDAVASNLAVQGTPSCAVTAPDTCTVANPSGSTWTFAVSLAAGDQATVTFSAKVAPGDTADVVNTATVTEGPCDHGSSSSTAPVAHTTDACTSTVTNPVPNFTVTKTASPPGGTAVSVGGTLTYTLVATNVGDGTGSDTVTDTLPPGLTVSAIPSCAAPAPGACTVANPSGSTWTFAVVLAGGASATATITATVDPAAAGTTLTNTATIGDPCNTAAGCAASVSNPVNQISSNPTTAGGTTPPSGTVPTGNPPVATAAASGGPVTSPSTLAFTGAYLAQLALFALALLGLGSALLLAARWRRTVGRHAARR